MICPYCNQEMMHGYIKSGRNIHFDILTAWEDSFPIFSKTSIALGNVLKYTQIECYHCVTCQKFIFDNPKKK